MHDSKMYCTRKRTTQAASDKAWAKRALYVRGAVFARGNIVKKSENDLKHKQKKNNQKAKQARQYGVHKKWSKTNKASQSKTNKLAEETKPKKTFIYGIHISRWKWRWKWWNWIILPLLLLLLLLLIWLWWWQE